MPRTEEDKELIKQSLFSPYSIENALTSEEVDSLLRYFLESENKEQKATGPLTLGVPKDDLSLPPFKSVLEKFGHLFGDDSQVFTALYFQVSFPHIIHNDDSFEFPLVCGGLNIPLEIKGNDETQFVIFDQYYLDGPAKFFNGDTHVPTHYNQQVYSYESVVGLSDNPITNDQASILTHLRPKWLQGLSVQAVLPWRPGLVNVFHPANLHCSGDFRKVGVTTKTGLSLFFAKRQ